MKRAASILGAVTLALAGVAASVAMAGGAALGHTLSTITQTTGHTPVTFCHKPGTPAEQELTTDDDGFLQGHLGHGDTLGPCPPTGTTGTIPTDTTPTDTTPTETTPTTPTPTTPTGERCPPGMTPTKGKDGEPGNDECEFPPAVTTPSSSGTVSSSPPVQTVTVTQTVTSPPKVITKTKVKVVHKTRVVHKTKVKLKIIRVSKPHKGIVKITTSDGKTHTAVMGSG